jgi:hypothetical protein
MPLTPLDARSFSTRWFAAWNSHNIDSMMACYDPAIEHSSPFIKRYNDAIGKGDEPSIKGIPDLRAYFQRALDRNPTLRFDPVDCTTGLESVILTYRRHSHDTPPAGDLSAEIFFLVPHAEANELTYRIIRSVSHYA